MWGRLEQVAGLASALGVVGTGRALIALARHHPVPFKVDGRTLCLPPEPTTPYHLRHSTPKLARLAAFVQPGDLVFDVGSHAGVFAALAVQRGASKVVAVEPNPALGEYMRRNAPSAHIVKAAVGDTAGRTTLWSVAESSQMSSLDKAAAETFSASTPIDVEVVTLAELVERHGQPDVLKLDIQGGESAVIASAWEAVKATRVVLAEMSLLDKHMAELLGRLSGEFGDPVVVNDVYAGADTAFVRGG